MPDLLIELFSEEIPARMQPAAAEALRRMMTDGLVEDGLTYAEAQAFATPRRLALAVQGLSEHSPTLREERRGPRVGAPDKAVQGFLRATGLGMDDLQIRDEKKGQVYLAPVVTPGRPAAQIVAARLEHTVRHFPWPKSMRWGTGSLRWVRPLHAILCILTTDAGADIVPLEIDGLAAGDTTRGHRFMAPAPFSVADFEDYASKLKRAKVILDPQERAAHIRNAAEQLAFANGLELVADDALLTEVAGLVEWPVVLMGRIEERFLDLPPEVLQTSMKEHQKFFSVRDPKREQIVGFVTVANRETADQGATILAGNQKVLAARLADARFFWDNDLRVARAGMQDWCDGLATVTFHAKLGSQAARVDRIAALAREIAPQVGADPEQAQEAARIAKADLRSEIVGEFPELQGVMGRYYALEAGRSPEVADACRDHWKPMGQDDDVPSAPVSVAVALADKLDTLTGFWAIEEKPTGSKDPYALRRAALGVIRLILGNEVRLKLSGRLVERHVLSGLIMLKGVEFRLRGEEIGSEGLRKLLTSEELKDISYRMVDSDPEASENQLLERMDKIVADLLAFFHDRLKVHLRGAGIRHDVIDACLAMDGADDLTLLVKRAEALEAFLRTDDGENLLQGFKRANNILTQAEDRDGVEYSFGPDPKLAETDVERALFAALDRADTAIAPALQAEDFAAAMHAIAGLRAPIDAFFDAVQINADNQILRRNRLNLLHRIRASCLQVADLTKLEG